MDDANLPEVFKAATSAEIGEMLKRARENAGLSQEIVATRMETSRSNVIRLEKGRTTPNVSTLEKYAAAIGRTFELRLK